MARSSSAALKIASTPSPKGPWIVSARQDLFFFILSPWISIAVFGLYLFLSGPMALPEKELVYAFFIVFVLAFDHPHILQTFSRTHVDRVERKRHRFTHWVLLPASLTGLWFYPELVLGDVFETMFEALGCWHIYRQNAGFLTLYGRRDPAETKILRLEKIGLTSIFLAYLGRAGIRELALLPELQPSQWLWMPVVQTAYYSVWALWAGCFAYWAHYHWKKYRRDGKFFGPRTALVLSLFAVYPICVYAITFLPLAVMLVVDTLYHDLQYLRWMAHYQKKKLPSKHIALKWLVACVAVGFFMEFGQDWFLAHRGIVLPITAVFTGITIYHYIIDGFVWRFRTQSELKGL